MTKTNTIYLQGIGTVPAVQLAEITAGDTLRWNAGVTTEVVAVTPVNARTVELTIRGRNGETTTTRKRAATLVARVA